ncbi:hypothetical protein AM305_10965 [Actinobacillus minor NM305]|uniref:Uncharacterized protein n=1 Tax=Actinobacillus minor NM305 TaxID=637911 RepID=C5S2T9_9PAST|nr:hypothetical protein [Actinobacillus minor]EER46694.1 hypothetical protein AM305_10965 [Actinobacillus minor NM305]
MCDELLPYLSAIKLCEIEWASWFSGIATFVISYSSYRQSRNLHLYEQLRELDRLFNDLKDKLIEYIPIYVVDNVEMFFECYPHFYFDFRELENYLNIISSDKKITQSVRRINDILQKIKEITAELTDKKISYKKDSNSVQLKFLLAKLDDINRVSSELSIEKQHLFNLIYKKMGVSNR